MHRHDKRERSDERKKGQTKLVSQVMEDAAGEPGIRPFRRGRRSWQQERRLLQQMDLKNLSEYLLDQE